jgi:hypothetical protein
MRTVTDRMCLRIDRWRTALGDSSPRSPRACGVLWALGALEDPSDKRMDRLTDQPARTWPPSSQEDSQIVSGACVWSSGVSEAASKVKVNCCLETRTCTVGRCIRGGPVRSGAASQLNGNERA